MIVVAKKEEMRQKEDYQRIFGTREPTLTQLRELYLKDENVFGKNEDKEQQKMLNLRQKSILQDPLLDNEDSLISAVYLGGGDTKRKIFKY